MNHRLEAYATGCGIMRSTMKQHMENTPIEMDLLGLSSQPAELTDEEIVSAYLQSRNAQDFERLVHR